LLKTHRNYIIGASVSNVLRNGKFKIMIKIPKVILLLESARAPDQCLLRGIAKYSSLHGPWFFYRNQPTYLNPYSRNKKILSELKNLNPDGIITIDSKRLEDILALGVPTIVANIQQNRFPKASYISSDPNAIGEMAADYLLERGFRQFAFCGYSNMPWSHDRAECFAKHIADKGYKTCFYLRQKTRTKSYENDQIHMADWLSSLKKPVAILACNDDRCQDIVEACKLGGINIPIEIALLGIDNDEFICDLSHPSISSIALNTEKAGYLAAELLDRLMKGEKTANQTILSKPTHIVTRQSTDILSIEDKAVAEAMRFILSHAKKAIVFTDVINTVLVSRRVLERRFRDALGRSIHDEIRRTRTAQISRMLIETTLTISEIATALDFPGIEHMARYYGKEKGMSLMAYRKNYGKK